MFVFYRDEDRSVPQVVQALINLSDQVHIAVRYTGIKLIGELCDWINTHPQFIGMFGSFFFKVEIYGFFFFLNRCMFEFCIHRL